MFIPDDHLYPYPYWSSFDLFALFTTLPKFHLVAQAKMHFPAVLVATFASLAAAHPGHDHSAEVVERREFIQNVARSDLGHCAEKLKARGVEARAVQRRKAIADAKAKRGITARDVSDKNKSHLSTADYDLNTPLDVIFATNNSCLLSPEVTEGPYCKFYFGTSDLPTPPRLLIFFFGI